MKIYYAHCIAIYGTPQEDRDVTTLMDIFNGAVIINPNSPQVEEKCTRIKEIHAACKQGDLFGEAKLKELKATLIEIDAINTFKDAGAAVMNLVFEEMAKSCDLLVFRALPDGSIPAGVYKEMTWAQEAGIPVMELPSNLSRREMTVQATREYLKEVGQR